LSTYETGAPAAGPWSRASSASIAPRRSASGRRDSCFAVSPTTNATSAAWSPDGEQSSNVARTSPAVENASPESPASRQNGRFVRRHALDHRAHRHPGVRAETCG
jgi:hypothetical protein